MDALLKALINNGALVSAILLIGYIPAGLAIARLWTTLQACQNGRLEDAKEALPILENTNRVNTAIAAAMENRTRVTDALDRTVGQLVQEQEHLERTVDRLAGRRE